MLTSVWLHDASTGIKNSMCRACSEHYCFYAEGGHNQDLQGVSCPGRQEILVVTIIEKLSHNSRWWGMYRCHWFLESSSSTLLMSPADGECMEHKFLQERWPYWSSYNSLIIHVSRTVNTSHVGSRMTKPKYSDVNLKLCNVLRNNSTIDVTFEWFWDKIGQSWPPPEHWSSPMAEITWPGKCGDSISALITGLLLDTVPKDEI